MAIVNFAQVDARLARMSRGVFPAFEEVARRHMIQIATEVVMRTPVDTGLARSSWTPALGQLSFFREAFIVSRSPGQGRVKARAAFRGFRLGERMTVSNGLAYIGRLEDGHSQQAPSGFIFQTCAAAAEFTNRNASVTFQRFLL